MSKRSYDELVEATWESPPAEQDGVSELLIVTVRSLKQLRDIANDQKGKVR